MRVMHSTVPRPLKVLHLITGLDAGGAETTLLRLVSHTDRSQFQSEVVSLLPEGSLAVRFRKVGIAVSSLQLSAQRPHPQGLLRLVRLLRTRRPDVLQTWMFHADLLGLLAGHLARTPLIAWNIRGTARPDWYHGPMTTAVVRACARLSPLPDAVVVNSFRGRQDYTDAGYRPKRWEVIPNGFDTELFRPDEKARKLLRARMNIPETSLVIGMAARLDPMKDHATFLRAATLLGQRLPTVHFVFAGRGVEGHTPGFRELARATGLNDRLHLLGEREDMPALYSSFDLASLSSSFGEGFARVLGEAMACAVPCVATDVSDSAEILGSTGLTVPPGDAEALAAAWQLLLEKTPTERKQLGQEARNRVIARYGMQAMVQQYEALYRSLAQKNIAMA